MFFNTICNKNKVLMIHKIYVKQKNNTFFLEFRKL